MVAPAMRFAPIVAQGMVFKDGLSSVHGEYSHTLQWAIIGWAVATNRIQLSRPVVDVYRALVNTQYLSANDLEKEFEQKEKAILWEVVCDCFEPKYRPREREHCRENIFSDSHRSPAYLTRVMLTGELSSTSCGALLHNRHTRKAFHIAGSDDDIEADTQTIARQTASDRGKMLDDEGGGQVAYRPEYMSINRTTRRRVTTTSVSANPRIHELIQEDGNRVNYVLWSHWNQFLV